MRNTMTILAGVALIILQSVLLRVFGVLVYTPQLAVACVAYVAFRRTFAQGAAATLVFGTVADLCWGGPRGYYALGLTLSFFAFSLVRTRFSIKSGYAAAFASAPGVILTDVTALVSLAVFRRGHSPLDALAISPVIALWTALITFPLCWIALRIDRLWERREHKTVSI